MTQPAATADVVYAGFLSAVDALSEVAETRRRELPAPSVVYALDVTALPTIPELRP